MFRDMAAVLLYM